MGVFSGGLQNSGSPFGFAFKLSKKGSLKQTHPYVATKRTLNLVPPAARQDARLRATSSRPLSAPALGVGRSRRRSPARRGPRPRGTRARGGGPRSPPGRVVPWVWLVEAAR